MTLDKALKISPMLKEMYDGQPRVKELIDTALTLEGMPRHASTHAAGVLITGKPVVEFVPLQRNDEVITTQYPMGTIEHLGLLKMDFLGLRTLTVIRDTLDMMREAPARWNPFPGTSPGSMNPDSVRYKTEKLRPILDVTYGCMVYQEQVMQIVRDLAGYSYGRSDLVRRAMAKKKHKVMEEEREIFVHGMTDADGNITVPAAYETAYRRTWRTRSMTK